MHYSVSGRAPSFISMGLAILIATGMHLSAAARHHDWSDNQASSRHEVKSGAAPAHA